jgi:hypothetical protein
MKLAFLGAAALALGIAAPAAATGSDPAGAAAKPNKERRICKTAIRSGSHLSTTICKTQSQWLALEDSYDDTSEVGVPGNRPGVGRTTDVGGQPPEKWRLPKPR